MDTRSRKYISVVMLCAGMLLALIVVATFLGTILVVVLGVLKAMFIG